MPSLPFYYTSFAGGFDTKDAPYLLDNGAVLPARDVMNIQGTTVGAIVKRAGLVTLSSPADTFTSLFPLEATASLFLIGAGGTSLYKVTTGGVASTIKTGLTAGTKWEWVASQATGGQGPLYGMNGVDTPQQWDGVAGTTSNWTATTGSVPNGKYMVTAGNRIWVTGVAATPSRVFFSDLIPGNNGPVTWPAANVSVFDENDGQPITGIGHVGPYILVTKARRLYVIYDFNTGDARRLSDNIGCVSHRSIAQSTAGTYFLSEDRGVYLTNGTKVTPISDKIQPTIDSIQAGLRTQAAGACINGHYYLSVPLTSTTNDTTLDWDEAIQSWWKHSFGSNQFAVWHPAGVASLYSAKATSAIVDQCFVKNVTQDNGANFAWVWRGPWQSPTFYRRRRFPTPYFRKRLRQVRLDGTGTVDFSIAKDFAVTETLVASNIFPGAAVANFGGSTTYGGLNLFGGGGTIQRARFHSLGVANAFSLVLGSTSNTADSVDSYVLMMTDRKDGVVS